MTVLLTLVGISLAVWILWLADKWGLGEGGELLFKVCIGVGAIWLAYESNLGVVGVLVFLAVRRHCISNIVVTGRGNGRRKSCDVTRRPSLERRLVLMRNALEKAGIEFTNGG